MGTSGSVPGGGPPADGPTGDGPAGDGPAGDGPAGAGTVLSRWFRPLADTAILWCGLYLLVGVVLGWVLFALVAAALAVSLVLVVLVIGVPLTLATFAGVDALARMECARAGRVGVPVEPRRPGPGRGIWSRFVTVLGDPVRWRQVAYLLLAPALATAALTAFVVGWAVPISLVVGGWTGDVLSGILEGLVGTAIGVLLLPLAARLSVALGRGTATFTRMMLGRDPAAAARERVEELTASRAEVLRAVAAERRRIERNLHDGVQQRLVALGLDLAMAERRLADDPERAAELLGAAREHSRLAVAELRAIGRGMHPAVLGDRGLDAALSAVVAAAPLPVSLRCEVTADLPPDIAETAYYVVAEAVANLMKHAGAESASVAVVEHGGTLYLEVVDDGRGGAQATAGGGLAGVLARVRALDGRASLDSPPGGPTVLRAVVPVPGGTAGAAAGAAGGGREAGGAGAAGVGDRPAADPPGPGGPPA